MLTFKRLLAASSAVVLGAGSGYATSVLAQTPSGPPTTTTGNPPLSGTSPAPATNPPPPGQNAESNFKRDATVSVMQHPREGYEARGIRAGTFLVYPQINIQLQHDDNIYATSTNEIDDTIWRIQPQITATSDWNRHALQAYVRGSLNRFVDNDTENTDEYGFGVSGRLDVQRDTDIGGQIAFSHATEPRTSPNSPAAALKPVEYDLWTVGARGRHEFNRLLLTGRIQSLDYDYSSPPSAGGGFVEQSYRNRTVTTYAGRLDYALSPKTAIFGELQGENHHQKTRPAGTIDRDSTGYQALVGVNFELTNLVRGDVGVGYRRETFDDAASKDLNGFSYNGALEWFPTQLTTITLNATRTVEDSAVAGSPAYLSSNLRGRVDHELLRNVVLTGQVGWGRDKYTGIVREDERKSAGLAASYLINRTVGVSATYDYSEQKTKKGTGSNFKDNKVGVTLTVQY